MWALGDEDQARQIASDIDDMLAGHPLPAVYCALVAALATIVRQIGRTQVQPGTFEQALSVSTGRLIRGNLASIPDSGGGDGAAVFH